MKPCFRFKPTKKTDIEGQLEISRPRDNMIIKPGVHVLLLPVFYSQQFIQQQQQNIKYATKKTTSNMKQYQMLARTSR
ncbi:hypothetical protein DERP_010403 [Dermatophagoides pteronyssinus]|uniref:Uncharacterized protein n=1 Tax=Dermatophagoides pteronyssinus TaxID=6956 RepID=A0ABQ8J4T7_DERPT|nr:hypothetical protein DERP_010403 [Dermatophagoides pteronyssinus]